MIRSTTPSQSSKTPSGPRARADFDGRLLAEAVRLAEQAEGKPFEDPAAEASARAASGDFEQRIVQRARALEVSKPLLETLSQFQSSLRGCLAVALALAFAAGAATGHAALSAEAGEAVNFHWTVLALLGVASLTLCLWILLTLLAPRAPTMVSLGGLTAWAARRLAGAFSRGTLRGAMMKSAANAMLRGGIARWTVGAMTHGLWLSFLLGALAMTLLILSTRQVVFAWQTTILSEAAYLPITRALAVLPELLGFTTPTSGEILDSRWTGAGSVTSAASNAWAGLLVGCIVAYGILPRLCALAFCLFAHGRAKARFRLDPSAPGYLRLREKLMPSAEREGVVDPDREGPEGELPPPPVPSIDRTRSIAILGSEIDAAAGWPPSFAQTAVEDIGLVDSRQDRERALEALRGLRPGLVLIAVSALTTPDRGVAAFVTRVAEASDAPMALLLTEAGRLRARYGAEGSAERFEDWRRLAARCGIPPSWVAEFDLGDADQAALDDLLGRAGP